MTSHQKTKLTIKFWTNAKRQMSRVRSSHCNQSKEENKIFHPHIVIIQWNNNPEAMRVCKLWTHKSWTTTTTTAPEATTTPEPTRTSTGTRIDAPVVRTTPGTMPTRRTTGMQCLNHQNGPARNWGIMCLSQALMHQPMPQNQVSYHQSHRQGDEERRGDQVGPQTLRRMWF